RDASGGRRRGDPRSSSCRRRVELTGRREPRERSGRSGGSTSEPRRERIGCGAEREKVRDVERLLEGRVEDLLGRRHENESGGPGRGEEDGELESRGAERSRAEDEARRIFDFPGVLERSGSDGSEGRKVARASGEVGEVGEHHEQGGARED